MLDRWLAGAVQALPCVCVCSAWHKRAHTHSSHRATCPAAARASWMQACALTRASQRCEWSGQWSVSLPVFQPCFSSHVLVSCLIHTLQSCICIFLFSLFLVRLFFTFCCQFYPSNFVFLSNQLCQMKRDHFYCTYALPPLQSVNMVQSMHWDSPSWGSGSECAA